MDLNIYFAKESGKLKEDPGKDDTVAGLAAIPLPWDQPADKQQCPWDTEVPALTIWV